MSTFTSSIAGVRMSKRTVVFVPVISLKRVLLMFLYVAVILCVPCTPLSGLFWNAFASEVHIFAVTVPSPPEVMRNVIDQAVALSCKSPSYGFGDTLFPYYSYRPSF